MGALNVPPTPRQKDRPEGTCGTRTPRPGAGTTSKGGLEPPPISNGAKKPYNSRFSPRGGGGTRFIVISFFFVVFCTFVRINLIIMRIELIVLC